MKLDNEIVIGWEPHMMRSVGPRAKMLVFGTKYGMVVVTNRRFLFLSEGESGFSGQFSRNVQEIDSQYLDSESSIDIVRPDREDQSEKALGLCELYIDSRRGCKYEKGFIRIYEQVWYEPV